ncbi:hypothetical protein ABZ829_27525 [Streptomyces xanthochromogenes]|uniref:hypothetical protein n=1 Tax=Streptomyces xanthochromogenes TaxID=67384 RepID=UPI00341AAD39
MTAQSSGWENYSSEELRSYITDDAHNATKWADTAPLASAAAHGTIDSMLDELQRRGDLR